MKVTQVRSVFLDFFAERGHQRVHSSSLVPANDPTLLFTNAGMVQFKDVFTGRETREISRATSSQKCVRAGGKHNDLDEVGRTPRHHTFFEMLGNFSFGDYFKEDAIQWAWELLTHHYRLHPDHLLITVFAGDDGLQLGPDTDARSIWKRVTGLPDSRIVELGKSENFWMMGDTGPMGPCSEIHYFTGNTPPTSLPTSSSPASVWESWMEIWNLVFMQYERKVSGGPLTSLPAPSIDTGAGLERLASVLQGTKTNYDTDGFLPLIHRVGELAAKSYGKSDADDVSMRVIADHARATAFLIADGVFPDKTGREYVLRRIMRRAIRHGHLLGISEPFIHHVCETVVDQMSGAFPELETRRAIIGKLAHEEEKRFRATLERGLGLLEDEFANLKTTGTSVVPGSRVFQLYDTFGFPEDLTQIIAQEQGFDTDMAGFEAELDRARDRSRFVGAHAATIAEVYTEIANEVPATKFLGYAADGLCGQGKILALSIQGDRVAKAEAGSRVAIVCDQTSFYAESGGQLGDRGTATSESGAELRVDDTRKPSRDVFVHFCEVLQGSLQVGDTLHFHVDETRRNRIRANHSATHLLHYALKQILGDHVAQKGSMVAPDRLRFDFSHFEPLTTDQIRKIEDWVNAQIRANVATKTEVLPIDKARERGAVAMFGEKYGDSVRVVNIGTKSLEFCGGTHVRHTGDIGLCKIINESGIAQGVRRIEAATGAAAVTYLRRLEDELVSASEQLKIAPLELSARLQKVNRERKQLEREIAALKAKLASGGGGRDLMSEVKILDGVKVLATTTEVSDAKILRETGDTLRNRLGSGIILLIGVGNERLSLLAMVTKDLAKRFHAGNLLKSVASVVDGTGGGRADMAQGGGKNVKNVSAALQQAETYIRNVGSQ